MRLIQPYVGRTVRISLRMMTVSNSATLPGPERIASHQCNRASPEYLAHRAKRQDVTRIAVSCQRAITRGAFSRWRCAPAPGLGNNSIGTLSCVGAFSCLGPNCRGFGRTRTSGCAHQPPVSLPGCRRSSNRPEADGPAYARTGFRESDVRFLPATPLTEPTNA